MERPIEEATRKLWEDAGKVWPGPDHSRTPPAPTFNPRPEALLLDYLRQRFAPTFKRGGKIFCASGETKSLRDALGEPTSGALDSLASAEGVPTFAGGGIKRNAMPGFFRTWLPVAWGNLLEELPTEDEAPEGEAAREEFRRWVRDALLFEITLGDVIGRGGVTQTERRSLADWCCKFAKVGPWKSIRSFKCWCKAVVFESGEFIVRAAIRPALFAQVRCDRRLAEMNTNVFGRRAKRYGVGETSETERPHGARAVILSDEFFAELTEGLADHEDEPTEFAGALSAQEVA